MIDHATRCSVSCVVTSKRKELIVKKILNFKHFVKILVLAYVPLPQRVPGVMV